MTKLNRNDRVQFDSSECVVKLGPDTEGFYVIETVSDGPHYDDGVYLLVQPSELDAKDKG